jgi:hypothetical protein
MRLAIINIVRSRNTDPILIHHSVAFVVAYYLLKVRSLRHALVNDDREYLACQG